MQLLRDKLQDSRYETFLRIYYCTITKMFMFTIHYFLYVCKYKFLKLIQIKLKRIL